MNLFVVLSLLAVSVCASNDHKETRKPLTENIRHYETLSYDTGPVRTQHERLKRGVPSSSQLQVSFQAFDRDFTLDLAPSQKVFAPGVKFLLNHEETTGYDPQTFYQGQVVGDTKSRVSGHVMDGVFDGSIATSEGEYQIEHARKFFQERERRDFHSVIYRSSDVDFEQSETSCAAKGEILEQMRKLQSTAQPMKTRGQTVAEYLVNRERQKRARASNGTFCQVFVAADHLFLQEVGGGDPASAISEIATIMSQVQDIYRRTDFDRDGTMDGIIPTIARTQILDQNSPGYRFGASNIAVNNFLDLWSQEDHREFCLALLLTYRDFAQGVLGLAWVAEPAGGNRGGICEGRVRLQVGERSLNTAIVTFLNYGARQPRSVSVVTVAHEFGHNFGSPHDPSTTQCSPGSPQGNFIMFPRATDGSQTNNRMFSPCSINSINAVLETNNGCFTTTGSFCGNSIVEDEEQCDCGDTCDQDPCCYPNCTLTPGSICSSRMDCCDDRCQPLNNTVMCQEPTDCGLGATCTGSSGECPAPTPRPGMPLCNNDMNLCVDGVCTGSVCLVNNLEDCQCTGNSDQLCHICCRMNGECISSFTLQSMGVLQMGDNRDPGRSCNNFEGYCSNADPPVCLGVDNEQTLNDLRNIFTLDTLNNIVAWLTVYWYVPVIVVVVILALMILLPLTYRKRKPLKRRLSRARNSLRRGRGGAPDAVDAPSRAAHRRPGPQQLSQREAINRLKKFFPTAETDTVIAVLQASPNEGRAVKRLLELGYPLRKIPIPRA